MFSQDRWSRRRWLVGAAALTAAGLGPGCAASGAQTPRERLRERIRARRAGEPAPPAPAAAAPSLDARSAPGPFGVDVQDGVWSDASRGGRAVPWRLYAPGGLGGRAPVAIYSHGGGGTRESGAQYGRHLASHGLASLHLQHAGSDRDAFRADPQQISAAARDPKLGAVRFQDVGFAAAELERGAFAERLDAARLGVYGHSFGAITTQIVAGQFVNGFDRTLALPRLRGAAALSPSPPRPAYADESTAFDDMVCPVLHLTGTEDDAPNGDFEAPARRVPFDRIRDVDQYLLILEGANHFTFGGDPNPQLRGRSFAYPGLERHHALIRSSLLAFFGWTLAGEAAQRAYLDQGFRSLLGGSDVFEAKRAA